MLVSVSYFASKAPADRKVCIAKKAPRYFRGPRFPEFAPAYPWDMKDWQARYRRELEVRFPDAASLRDSLARIEAATPDPILCCYEKAPSDCHRSILAGFIFDRLGLTVPEWTA